MSEKEILEFIKNNRKEVLKALKIHKEIKVIKALRKFFKFLIGDEDEETKSQTNLQSQLTKKDEEIKQLHSKLSQLQSQIEDLTNKLSSKDKKIEELNRKLQLKDEYHNTLKSLYDKLTSKEKLKFIIKDTSSSYTLFAGIYNKIDNFWEYVYSLHREAHEDFEIAREMLYFVVENSNIEFIDNNPLKGIKYNGKIKEMK